VVRPSTTLEAALSRWCRDSKGTELDVLNEWLNVLNSVQLPFALVPVSLGCKVPLSPKKKQS
jgi:hypothetical protein